MKTFNKIILLFFIFSSSLLAKWEVYIDSSDCYVFRNFNANKNAAISILVDIELMDDWSAAYNRYSIAIVGVVIAGYKFNFDDNSYYLKIKRNSKNSINYNISEDNVIELDGGSGIFIGKDNQESGAGRVANNLIKILLDSVSCDLYNEDELLASFNLVGLKQIIKENIGDTEWYYRLYD